MCKKNKDHSIACFVDEMEFICSDLVVNDVLKFIVKNITSPLLIVNSFVLREVNIPQKKRNLQYAKVEKVSYKFNYKDKMKNHGKKNILLMQFYSDFKEAKHDGPDLQSDIKLL